MELALVRFPLTGRKSINRRLGGRVDNHLRVRAPARLRRRLREGWRERLRPLCGWARLKGQNNELTINHTSIIELCLNNVNPKK